MNRTSCYLIASLLTGSSAWANFGESTFEAKAHGEDWKAKYQAMDGLFTVGRSGQVEQECWAGPENGWTEAFALQFALELVPPSGRKQAPAPGEVDSFLHHYSLSGGFEVILAKRGYVATMLEVRAPGFTGPEC